MKLISVVTITRDNQEEVIKVFNELKNQDYINWIFIVVDDYSKITLDNKIITNKNIDIKNFKNILE